MGTTLKVGRKTITYTITTNGYAFFFVEISENKVFAGYLRNNRGDIRFFTTRSGARKAISRAVGNTAW